MRPLLAVLVVLLSVTAGGCAAFREPTSPGIGSSDRESDIALLSAAVVTDGDGHGTLVGALDNTTEEEDQLVGVTITSERGDIPAELPQPVTIGPEETVELADTAHIAITSDKLRPGFLFEIHLDFAKNRDVSVKVPVEEQKGPYAEVEIPS